MSKMMFCGLVLLFSALGTSEAQIRNDRRIQIQLPHARSIFAAAASYDGKNIAVIHYDGTVWVWNTNLAKPLGPYIPTNKPIRAGVINGGELLLTQDSTGLLTLFKLNESTAEIKYELRVCPRPNHIWFQEDGAEVFCPNEPTLQRWKISSNSQTPVKKPDSYGESWSLSSGGRWLLGFERSKNTIQLEDSRLSSPTNIPAPVGKDLVGANISAESGKIAVVTSIGEVCVLHSSKTWRCAEPIFKASVKGTIIEKNFRLIVSGDGCSVIATTWPDFRAIFSFCNDSAPTHHQLFPEDQFLEAGGISFVANNVLSMTSNSLKIARTPPLTDYIDLAVLRADAWNAYVGGPRQFGIF